MKLLNENKKLDINEQELNLLHIGRQKVLKGGNACPTAQRWFASNTAHIGSIYLFIYLIWYIIMILLYALTKQGYVLIYQGKFVLFYGGLMECTICEFAQHTLYF